jgi:hypothetical protein
MQLVISANLMQWKNSSINSCASYDWMIDGPATRKSLGFAIPFALHLD